MVPVTGVEPVRSKGPQDFKSCASANSATPAEKLAPKVGLEPTAYRLTAGCSTIELLRNTNSVVCADNIYILAFVNAFVNP